MRILLVNNLRRESGIGRYANSLYLSLRRIDGERVALYERRSALLDTLFQKSLGTPGLFWGEEAARFLNLLLLCVSIPRKYHLYHFLNPAMSALCPMMQPHVVTVYDLVPILHQRSSSDYILALLLKSLHPDRAICISEYTRRDLLRFTNLDAAKVRVVHCGVDHEIFRPRNKALVRSSLGLPSNIPIILNIGSEEPRKNLQVLLNTLGIVLRKFPKALLVRIGATTPATQRLITKLGLGDRVLYRAASHNEVPAYYNAADLLVFPSYYEGFGLPPLEAMASGCPVVASKASSIPEVVGDAGILLDPSDASRFAHWTEEILLGPEFAKELTERGLKRSASFTWEKCARETRSVYLETLDESFP